jgi:hypothetical protein
MALGDVERSTPDKAETAVNLSSHGQTVHDKPVPKLTVRVRFPSSAPVNGHWEIRLGGLVFSGLAATSFPGWWPRVLPAGGG